MDNLVEDMEENETDTIYDDYKFVTVEEVNELIKSANYVTCFSSKNYRWIPLSVRIYFELTCMATLLIIDFTKRQRKVVFMLNGS